MILAIILIAIGVGDILLTIAGPGIAGASLVRFLIDFAFIGLGMYRLVKLSRQQKPGRDKDA